MYRLFVGVAVLVALLVASPWSSQARASGEAGSEGHLFDCKGRVNGKRTTLRCCGVDSTQAHQHAYANFDMDRPPSCEITDNLCVVKDMGNCKR
jgi:hypothetical protein